MVRLITSVPPLESWTWVHSDDARSLTRPQNRIKDEWSVTWDQLDKEGLMVTVIKVKLRHLVPGQGRADWWHKKLPQHKPKAKITSANSQTTRESPVLRWSVWPTQRKLTAMADMKCHKEETENFCIFFFEIPLRVETVHLLAQRL